MQRRTTYREQSRIYLAQAHEELANGDLEQASEKGWGAAAQIVKAIAQQRGRYHRTHNSLRGTVNALIRETGDPELGFLFSSAGELHTNFYEHQSGRETVEAWLRDVARFVDKAEDLLEAPA